MSLTSKIDALAAAATQDGGIPGVVAGVCTADGVIYESAAGMRALGEPAPMTTDSVFWIASMSKALTSAAVMQLVEQGALSLDSPAAEIVPELGEFQVLTGFDDAGRPVLRAPRTPLTLRHLLTHSSGLSYDLFNTQLARYCETTGTPGLLSFQKAALTTPLMFDPGTRWEYGVGIDWAGRMVEAVSGLKLGDYLQAHLFAPLGMSSTSFRRSDDQRRRLVGMHARLADGSLAPMPFELPQDAEYDMGGGGLYGTVSDYLRFVRMILNRGTLDGRRVLAPETVAMMGVDQLPGIACGIFQTAAPAVSNVCDFYPGESQAWGLGFLINRQAVPGARSAGSLSWAGLSNCYYWIDPARGVAGVLCAQILPFFDAKVLALFREFERAVYADS